MIDPRTSVEQGAVEVCIGVLAWNEEDSIEATLSSLFEQSLLGKLADRKLRCQLVVVANGCTDRTASVARVRLETLKQAAPPGVLASCHVADLPERGKPNAWNRFVHELSDPRAKILCLMDADILFCRPDTLWNMYTALLEDPEALAAVDEPIKDIALKSRKTLLDRLSLATSRMAAATGSQLTGQLYCIRAPVARDIYLPRELLVEDGFIKAVICTDFLTGPPNPRRILQAPDAAHVFESYKSARAIFRNQKRQVIGQMMVHLLVDKELKGLGRGRFVQDLRDRERRDPFWLRRLIARHLAEIGGFWRLFPGVLTFRWRRLLRARDGEPAARVLAALGGGLLNLAVAWRAHRFLRQGRVDYWPDTQSPSLARLAVRGDRPHPPSLAPLSAEKTM